jgi:hypothetical protein
VSDLDLLAELIERYLPCSVQEASERQSRIATEAAELMCSEPTLRNPSSARIFEDAARNAGQARGALVAIRSLQGLLERQGPTLSAEELEILLLKNVAVALMLGGEPDETPYEVGRSQGRSRTFQQVINLVSKARFPGGAPG